MIPTYRYLNRSIRIGPLPIWQWIQVAVALLIAFGLSKLLALVMPPSWALSTAITIAGFPVAAAIVSMEADFDVPAYVKAAISWRRGPDFLLPGADPSAEYAGYQLTSTTAPQATSTTEAVALTSTDLEDLWDRS